MVASTVYHFHVESKTFRNTVGVWGREGLVINLNTFNWYLDNLILVLYLFIKFSIKLARILLCFL